ncbi:hypothetical protein [Priestia koreensis]|uniref:Uncharacterized protein n=1 Tax=Priestia koreensis TaxID=284581 RepID=A0A0M0LCK5_9BACI|nr:hypothetical protein [Priestia koreensis]KOO48592.1 hypothetical protein AMD01_04185 [Priestia koreensis]
MLMIRHAIGSRLFLQTEDYSITPRGEQWLISSRATEEEQSNLLEFRHELNLFHVTDENKTWYYSSKGEVHEGDGAITIVADHQTVYPKEEK